MIDGTKQYKAIILYIFIMENKQIYIKSDDNKIINEKCIIWVKKMDECLEVCTKSTGCSVRSGVDTHKICKLNNSDSYNKLNKYFE
jgi:hypothetical protein